MTYVRRLGMDDWSRGVEAYYSIALTPAAHLTLDAQIADSPFPGADTALIFGMRLNLQF